MFKADPLYIPAEDLTSIVKITLVATHRYSCSWNRSTVETTL